MYNGKNTQELKKLSKEYYDLLGHYPDGEMSVEYGDANYNQYISDIKECIKRKICIAALVEERMEADYNGNGSNNNK